MEEDNSVQQTQSVPKCLYVSTNKKEKITCNEPAITMYGFCKKHSRTIQGKKAREKWEAENLTQTKKEEEETLHEIEKMKTY